MPVQTDPILLEKQQNFNRMKVSRSSSVVSSVSFAEADLTHFVDRTRLCADARADRAPVRLVGVRQVQDDERHLAPHQGGLHAARCGHARHDALLDCHVRPRVPGSVALRLSSASRPRADSPSLLSSLSPDSARNPRGFACKFYTEEGNYDLVGLSWPVFFVRDPLMGTSLPPSSFPAPSLTRLRSTEAQLTRSSFPLFLFFSKRSRQHPQPTARPEKLFA